MGASGRNQFGVVFVSSLSNLGETAVRQHRTPPILRDVSRRADFRSQLRSNQIVFSESAPHLDALRGMRKMAHSRMRPLGPFMRQHSSMRWGSGGSARGPDDLRTLLQSLSTGRFS